MSNLTAKLNGLFRTAPKPKPTYYYVRADGSEYRVSRANGLWQWDHGKFSNQKSGMIDNIANLGGTLVRR
jgi:hypothetical protein